MSELIANRNTYLPWIDWMKIIGMYFIIAGHMFSVGYKSIYTFSVPVFFVVSGFLCKRENTNKLFLKKMFYNLIIPMICFTIINYLWVVASNIHSGTFDINSLWQLLLNTILGMQGEDMNNVGLFVMWFVYSLCVLKIILQVTPQEHENLIFLFLLMFCISGNIELLDNSFHVYNSWLNAMTAFPFFIAGYALQKYRCYLEYINSKIFDIVSIMVCMLLIYFCTNHNDVVMIYRASFGSSYLLFLIGGFAGTIAVYAFSRMVEFIDISYVRILSEGTIVILGFQWFFIRFFLIIGILHISPILDYIMAFIVLLMFVPINILVKRYIPFLYGIFRIKYKRTN